MSTDPELLKKLIDDDEIEDIELQKEESGPVIVIITGVAIPNPSSKKKRAARVVRGSWPCCCKCIGITTMIVALLCILPVFYAYYRLAGVIDQLTVETDSPRIFPTVQMSESELEDVIDRVTYFFDDIVDHESGSDIKDLILEEDEINGFIGHSDYLRGNFMVTFHEDRIVEEYSLPMDVLGFDGRYFVGKDYLALNSEVEQGDDKKNILEMKMEIEASHDDWFDGPLFFLQLQYLITKNKEDEGQNMLELVLENGSFFGQSISQEDIDEHHHNLLEGLYDAVGDEEEMIRKVISGIERVSIEEGKVVVKARSLSSN